MPGGVIPRQSPAPFNARNWLAKDGGAVMVVVVVVVVIVVVRTMQRSFAQVKLEQQPKLTDNVPLIVDDPEHELEAFPQVETVGIVTVVVGEVWMHEHNVLTTAPAFATSHDQTASFPGSFL